MPTIEPHILGESQDLAPESSRKAYHSPEFRDYGTVGDLTRTSSTVNVNTFDGSTTPSHYVAVTTT